ncbi:MAG TPA: hypothetical protein VG146_00275, partial [Verrucomicrobiae bacterium]|nr:hypothetical protein [Verrucomicrobiae bacterium]
HEGRSGLILLLEQEKSEKSTSPKPPDIRNQIPQLLNTDRHQLSRSLSQAYTLRRTIFALRGRLVSGQTWPVPVWLGAIA